MIFRDLVMKRETGVQGRGWFFPNCLIQLTSVGVGVLGPDPDLCHRGHFRALPIGRPAACQQRQKTLSCRDFFLMSHPEQQGRVRSTQTLCPARQWWSSFTAVSNFKVAHIYLTWDVFLLCNLLADDKVLPWVHSRIQVFAKVVSHPLPSKPGTAPGDETIQRASSICTTLPWHAIMCFSPLISEIWELSRMYCLSGRKMWAKRGRWFGAVVLMWAWSGMIRYGF